jgi:hypothetical protein
MPLENSRVTSARQSQNAVGSTPKGLGTVYAVILDETSPVINNKELDVSYVGAIQFRFSGQMSSDEAKLPVALPFDKNFKSLPVKNEIVEIIVAGNGQPYYNRIGNGVSPNVSNPETTISKLFTPEKDNSQTAQDYNKVQSTGIQRTNADESTKYDGDGDYFKLENGIHKLRLNEGDMVIESRFGQSIRFSAYNNNDRTFSPTVIIRNGESSLTRNNDSVNPINEDITRDGSIIAIGSNQYQLNFAPGTIDDKGTSDFETNPNSFKNYPSELKGDQILLNSGRIILSAKNAEMIFYSKKNYGFISDGGLSIDNKLGIEVNVGDNTNVKTNDRDINLNTGNGKINLGDTELEPLVKGDTWVSIMEELIDAIVAQNYLTPSGPSKVGPENLPTFNSIKSKLKTALSNLNKTS